MKTTSLFGDWGVDISDTGWDKRKTKLAELFVSYVMKQPGKYQEAINLFIGTKYENDADVLFTIGILYNDSCNSKFYDADKALEYFEKAYDAGNDAAKVYLLEAYLGKLEDPDSFIAARSLGFTNEEMKAFFKLPVDLIAEVSAIIRTLKEEQERLTGTPSSKTAYCQAFGSAAYTFSLQGEGEGKYEDALKYLDLVTNWQKPVAVLESKEYVSEMRLKPVQDDHLKTGAYNVEISFTLSGKQQISVKTSDIIEHTEYGNTKPISQL